MSTITILLLAVSTATTDGFGPIVTLTNTAKSTAQNYVDNRSSLWHLVEPLPLVDEQVGVAAAAVNEEHQRYAPFDSNHNVAANPQHQRSARKTAKVVISGRDRRASRESLEMFSSPTSSSTARGLLNSENEKVAMRDIREQRSGKPQHQKQRRLEVISGWERRQRRASRANFSPISYANDTPMLNGDTLPPVAKRQLKKTPNEVLEELDFINTERSISGSSSSQKHQSFHAEAPMDATPVPRDLPPHLSTIPGKGMGVITQISIPKGDVVGEYKGDAPPMQTHEDGHLDNKNNNSLPWIRFIDHASPPYDNVISQEHTSYNGELYVWLIAKRDIAVGEDICFNYGDEYWL